MTPHSTKTLPGQDGLSWPEGQRIAILNWRDSGHPQAGGAELYCFEVARWLAAQGAEVTVVTSRAPGQAARSHEDGVNILRGGGRLSVYLFAMAWLALACPLERLGRRGKIDAVLDCQNGIPFFAPLALGHRIPVVLLIHHVHQDQFDLHFGRRLARIGRYLEGPVSRWVYRGRPVVAVSPSTRCEIRKRLRFRNPMYVVPNGGPVPAFEARVSADHPTVVSVGRLVVQKHVDRMIAAVAEARQAIPDLVFHIVGDGEERPALERQVRELGLRDAVHFHGRVSDAERDAILSRSWLFLSASEREGWGVAVLEAAARGIPALVPDVPGLRDAVRDGATGWLVPEDVTLADALVEALQELAEPENRSAMASRCFAWAQNFSWTRSARRISEILYNEATRLSGHRPARPAQDLVTRVEIELEVGTEDRVVALLRRQRMTDEWRWMPDRLVGLLYGTDELGAERAVARLGFGDAPITVSVARSHDLLGDIPGQSRRVVPAVVLEPAAQGIAADLVEIKHMDSEELTDVVQAEIVDAAASAAPGLPPGPDASVDRVTQPSVEVVADHDRDLPSAA